MLGSLNFPFMIASAGTSSPDVIVSMDSIKTAAAAIFDVTSMTLNQIVSNPVFLIFFTSGLVFMSVRVIRALKHN